MLGPAPPGSIEGGKICIDSGPEVFRLYEPTFLAQGLFL